MLCFRIEIEKTYVYIKDDYADEMYFIVRGTAKFISDDFVYRTMFAGSHFGEYELLEYLPR